MQNLVKQALNAAEYRWVMIPSPKDLLHNNNDLVARIQIFFWVLKKNAYEADIETACRQILSGKLEMHLVRASEGIYKVLNVSKMSKKQDEIE